MNIVEKQVTKYSVCSYDFDTLEEANLFIRSVEEALNRTYYTVAVIPDLTEGSGYENKIIIGVEEGKLENGLLAFLSDQYGQPVSLVQSVTPIDTWVIMEKERFHDLVALEKHLTRSMSLGRGSYVKKQLAVYFLDNAGKLQCDTGAGVYMGLDKLNTVEETTN